MAGAMSSMASMSTTTAAGLLAATAGGGGMGGTGMMSAGAYPTSPSPLSAAMQQSGKASKMKNI